MTAKTERLSRNRVENKLTKYKTLNGQIGKKLNEKLMEITKLKRQLKKSTAKVSDVRKECSKLKRKILKAKNNADETMKILHVCIDDVDRILAAAVPVSIECITERRKKRKEELRVYAIRNNVERKQAVENVTNNCGSEEKADNDGQRKKSGENESKENGESAQHDGTKSMATKKSKTKLDQESSRISSSLCSRPKRSPAPIDYLTF